MRRLLSSLLLLLGLAESGSASPPASPGVTYVIPVRGMIERALVYVVRRAVAEAQQAGAAAIVFDMDTPGGRLDSTEEIINTIADVGVPTYTFVNPNAISAGAILSLATDHIYMAPGGRIGDAMPILMSPLPMSAPQEVPAGLKEKMVSPTAALIRSVAQRKGHDPKLAEAMVRPEAGYQIEDKVICKPGELLTLTAQDAVQTVGPEKRPLLAAGIVKNIPALLEAIGRGGDRVVTVEVTLAEKVARFIESLPVSGLLLGAGLLALYIEFKTPGFGLPGIAGIILLAIWFWGHHVAGLAGAAEVVMFLTGVALLLAEVFFFPGFGLAGASGIVLMVTGLLMAMVQHYPGGPMLPPAGQIQEKIPTLGATLAGTFLVAILLARFLPKTSVFQRLELTATQSQARGFSSAPPSMQLVGLRGVAVTALRPGGIGSFDDRRIDVIGRGDFIEKGASIVITEAHGNRIVVEAV